MDRRILLAGVLGALAMFVWLSIAHMALPLGEAGLQQVENEPQLLAAMQSTLHASGLYYFPKMDPNDHTAAERKMATGPSGLLMYLPSRNFNFGVNLAVEYATDFLQVVVVAYLLSLTRAATFAARLGFFAAAGLVAVVATNVSYWNWYAFPAAYILPYMFTGWVGYLCAGAVAGAMKVGGSQASIS